MTSEISSSSVSFQNIQAIVTDIEGTTTSLNFPKQILFPYAAQHMGKYVQENENNPEVSSLLESVRKISQAPKASTDEVIQTLQSWIKQDKKETPLKALQGMIWKKGFEEKIFRGHVYPDAHECMTQWHARKIPIYVYSSGSVQAQKLLFSHSDFGDIDEIFSGNFDTTTGPKREKSSYEKIANQIGVVAGRILFSSDTKEELDAAKSAGMQTVFLNRDKAPSISDHPEVTSFKQIIINP